MEWDIVLKIVLSVIASFGGAGAIIVAVTKFASENIATRLEKKYELKLNKELEEFKDRLAGKSYISRARFEAEFEMYRKLSEVTVNMVKEVSQLFPRFTSNSRTDFDTYKTKYDLAVDKVVIAQDALSAFAPFISADIYTSFNELEKKCKIQLGDFRDFCLRPDYEMYVQEYEEEYKNAWQRTTEIQNDLDVIINNLRNHLSKLEAIE